jgi:hypothetical protein
MLQDESDSQSVAASAIDGMERQESTQGRGGRIELCSAASEEATPELELANNAIVHSPVRELAPKNFLVSENWHRPYAHALMETDPLRLPPLILEAENAIFNRYLELCVSPRSIEHSRDIQNAIHVLMQLKNAMVDPAVSPSEKCE